MIQRWLPKEEELKIKSNFLKLVKENKIDFGIVKLMQSFNRIPGIATIWSCEGHTGNELSGYTPYVSFVYSLHRKPNVEKFCRLVRDELRFKKPVIQLSIKPKEEMSYFSGYDKVLKGECDKEGNVDNYKECVACHVHCYSKNNTRLFWSVVKKHLPILNKEIEL